MTSFIVGDGLSFRPAAADEFNFNLYAEVGYENFNASSVESIAGDANVTTVTSDYSLPYYDISVIGTAERVRLSALDATGLLTGNRLSRLSDGNCRVLAQHPLLSRTVTANMSRVNFNSYEVLRSYAVGSFARHTTDQIVSLIGDKTSAAKPIYSTQNHATGMYIRNTDSLSGPLDLTAVSPWNSRGGNTRAGTAITPRHTVQAVHYPLAKSDTLRFVAADNTVITRTVAEVNSIAGSDIQVALLNSDLPASITPLKFLPSDLYDYIPSIKKFPLHMLAIDAEEKAITQDTDPVNWLPYNNNSIVFRASLDEPFRRMTEAIIPGDSGNPLMFVVNNEPVLASHFSGHIVGPAYHKFLPEIASALSTLGGGHTLSTVDLSSFPTY